MGMEAVIRRLEDCYRTPCFTGLSVETDGEIVGFVLGYIEQWDVIRHFHLKEMCVVPDQQRRGVGSVLMATLEENLKNQGVERLYLTTARESPAQAFYASQEFHVSDKIILMSKRLDAK